MRKWLSVFRVTLNSFDSIGRCFHALRTPSLVAAQSIRAELWDSRESVCSAWNTLVQWTQIQSTRLQSILCSVASIPAYREKRKRENVFDNNLCKVNWMKWNCSWGEGSTAVVTGEYLIFGKDLIVHDHGHEYKLHFIYSSVNGVSLVSTHTPTTRCNLFLMFLCAHNSNALIDWFSKWTRQSSRSYGAPYAIVHAEYQSKTPNKRKYIQLPEPACLRVQLSCRMLICYETICSGGGGMMAANKLKT